MTDLAIREDRRAVEIRQPQLAAATPSSAIATLADWESELLSAGSIASKLCNTPFVPSHFRGKPADAAAAILTGFELGLSPMAALRSVFMISGTPGMYAKTMVAVLQAQGHSVWIEEQSKDRVVVCGRRKDQPANIPDARTVWDLERVKTAELLSNAQYKKNPQQMMKARGQAEICREIAMDALLGIPYSVEELESFDSPVRAEVVPQARVTADEILALTGKATTAEAPQATATEPTSGEAGATTAAVAEAGPEATEPDVEMITAAQQKKLHALLNDHGYKDRDAALGFISLALERDVDTTKTLTKAEATIVIDRLLSTEIVEPSGVTG